MLTDKLRKSNLSDKLTNTITVRPINKDIIDMYVDRLQLLVSSDDSESDGKPKLIHGSNLHTMFHLEMSGSIRKYRYYLLDKLKSMGNVGEKIWKEIISTTEYFEQNFKMNTAKRYPRSLREAYKVYGKRV